MNRVLLALFFVSLVVVVSHGKPKDIRDEKKPYITEKDLARARTLDDSLKPPPKKSMFQSHPDRREGDIALPKGKKKSDIFVKTRQSIFLEQDFWPEGRVPYTLDDNFPDEQRAIIAKAMDAFHRHTCIRFVPWSGDESEKYVQIIKDANKDNCYANVGMLPEGQQNELHLGNECFNYLSNVMHELMHTIGFEHEMSRFDRDQYIKIDLDNVSDDSKSQYDLANAETRKDLFTYDYASIMHYDEKAFSKNDKVTMYTVDPRYQHYINTCKNKFSQGDVDKINKLYPTCNVDELEPPEPLPTIEEYEQYLRETGWL